VQFDDGKTVQAMSESTDKPNPSPLINQQSVKFVFEKGGNYRTVHADGAWGRNDAFGNIHLTFFNEKPPMPASGVLELDSKTGQWAMDMKKLQIQSDAHLVRELEVDVTMTLPAAVAVRDTLNNFIHMVVANLEAQQKSKPEKST
jgi:hypothetical protein